MKAEIAIVGAGYVGVPLAQVFANAGRSVVLVDVQADRIAQLNRGESYIEDVPSEELKRLVDDGRVSATTDYDVLREVDAILIALPTPLSEQREPDLSIVLSATAEIALRLQKGQLVVLESTTYPGTTRERVKPLLEESGLTAGTDFHLAFSPERVDPGREDWTTQNTPKVVGGLTEECTKRAIELYGSAVEEIVPVSSPEAAELTKLLENIFRSVNIALVNELAQLCDRMNLDVWEIVDAAATKPFGFMRFEPGPGLGGHCLPVDPFYLSWKARQYDFYTEFIELAGKVNANMPYFCRSLISQALNHGAQRSLNGSKVLVLGVSYKANTADSRESPALKLIELLRNAGAEVAYHDPHVPELASRGLSSQPLDPGAYDCVAIVTAHSSIDYEKLVDEARLVVDFRNATGRNGRSGRKSLEAMTKIGLVGLGYWGPNLARNFDELAELRWLCDLEPDLRERFAPRYPEARVAGDFDELLNDPELEAVVIATPAVTHYELAKRALEAGKHVLVEKPPAMNAAEAEDLVSTAEASRASAHARAPVALPPRRADGEGPDGHRRARRGALRLLEPPEPRQDPGRRECALVPRRPRPLRDPAPARRGAFRDLGTWQLVPHARRRGHRLLLPALPLRENRAHAPLLARPAQDAQADRGREGEDGRLRRHGAGAQGDDLREGPVAADPHLRRVADPHRRHLQPEDPERRAVAARMPPLPRPRGRRGRPAASRPGRARGRACARAASGLAA